MIILISIVSFMLLIAFLFIKMEQVKRQRKAQTFIVNNRKVILSKKDIAELSRRNFLTHSWHSKRPGKNKGL